MIKSLAFFLFVTLASAHDFSQLKPGWMRNPTLVKLHEAMQIKSGIVGGNEATPHAYPHQVGIHIDGMYFCGGSLISNEGAHNIQENEETQVKVSTKQFATHEDWDTQ